MSKFTTKTIRCGSCTITIERPVLTSTEQAARETTAKETLGNVLRDYIRRKEQKA